MPQERELRARLSLARLEFEPPTGARSGASGLARRVAGVSLLMTSAKESSALAALSTLRLPPHPEPSPPAVTQPSELVRQLRRFQR